MQWVLFKRIVHPKVNICSIPTHSQATSRFLHLNRLVEMYYYISSSPDPLQWMGAVKMRVQTADKTITIIHMSPVHQLMSCDVESCMFVKKKLKKNWVHNNK